MWNVVPKREERRGGWGATLWKMSQTAEAAKHLPDCQPGPRRICGQVWLLENDDTSFSPRVLGDRWGIASLSAKLGPLNKSLRTIHTDYDH